MIAKEMIYPGDTRALVWWLVEEAPCLLAVCRDAGIHVDDLLDLPVKRQREVAAERLLLQQAFGKPVTLTHDGQGAPMVTGMDVSISITHTVGLVGLAWNAHLVVGLDAERIDRRQVIKVRDKFLNAAEQQFIAEDDQAAHIIAWTAKEAIIKAERNSAIDWTEGICLEPPVSEGGEAIFDARYAERRYRLVSRLLQDHMITLALPVEE